VQSVESVSASLTTDASGGIVAQSRYLPYGQERWTSGPAQTDFTYTGQRADYYTHLIEMGARWYDPYLNRWISADTMVPGAGNPQNLNRYSYVVGNPLRHIDPSGHCIPEVNCPSDKPGKASSNQDILQDTLVKVNRATMIMVWPSAATAQSTNPAFSNAVKAVVVPNRSLKLPSGTTVTAVTNELRLEREGLCANPSSLSNAMTGISNGLLVFSAIGNTVDIWGRQSSGEITPGQAMGETSVNIAATGINYAAGQAGSAVAAAAAPATGTATVTSVGVPIVVAIGLTAFSFDMMVAQGTANNMIEGQSFWPAVWNSRDSTIDEMAGIVGRNHEDWDKFLASQGIR
jgi:RHS repeat-associated protein